MNFHTSINGTSVEIPGSLVEKYDRPGPRYTSYPTAPVWTTDFGPKEYALALSNPQTHNQQLTNLSLYFHIPFCERRCNFCGCSTIATTKREVAEKYVEALCKEISIVSNHLGAKREVSQIHFGGGTPTYLSCEQIERIWRSQISHFKLTPDAEIGIEIDPRVTSMEQLKLLRKLGFNRISLGVQDFSKKVQETIGRIEPFSFVQQMVNDVRELGFKSVNIDLVYGLPYQTKETFRVTIEKIVELSPDRIACFNFAYVPWMMPHQKVLPKDAMPSGMEKFEIFCQTIEHLCHAGYDFIGMDHFARSSDELAIAAKNGTLGRDFQGYTTRGGHFPAKRGGHFPAKRGGHFLQGSVPSLIGFGLTSIGDICGSYAQNTKKLIDYHRSIDDGKLATVRGWKLSDDDLRRRTIIRELFCNGMAEISNLLARRGGKFEIADLLQDGLVEKSGDILKVTPLGRLFVRNIAMAFDAHLKDGGKFSRTV